jgi:hypothetical protein
MEAIGRTVEATVEVSGLPSRCSKTASCSTRVIRESFALKLDEYGDISFRDEKARLANFAVELQNNPSALGYVIAYGARRGRPGEAQRRADRARNLLVPKRNLGRIVTVDGGFRNELTIELWLVPSGTTPPPAAPTVDSSEVQIRGGRRKGRKGVRN